MTYGVSTLFMVNLRKHFSIFFVLSFLAIFKMNAIHNFSKENLSSIKERILKPHMKFAKTKFNLFVVGTGGGLSYIGPFVEIHYDSLKNVKEQEARRMLIELTEDLMKRVNESKEIRPFLWNYPFIPYNAHITISFPEKKIDDARLIWISSILGRIIYFNKKNGKLNEYFEEAYPTNDEMKTNETL